jgi:DNA-binding NarL/FixJ family response regulator
MPQMDGVETARGLIEVCPSIKVLILSDVESEEALMRALRVGAYGYVLKTQPFEAVLRAIDMANDGSLTLPRDLTVRAIGRERTIRSTAKRLSASSDLTDRERQILRWITTGESNRQIAERLVISEHTVRAHLRNLMIKLGVANRAQAAAVAANYLGSESDEQQGVRRG